MLVSEKSQKKLLSLPFLNKGRKVSEEERKSKVALCERIFDEIKEANHLDITVPFVLDPDYPVMGVYNRGIKFGPDFIDKFTQSELAFIIGHEVAHILHGHIENCKSLGIISAYVQKEINKIKGKDVSSDFTLIDFIEKRYEHEADILGASLARKAGYCDEESALQKMDDGLAEYARVFNEHPIMLQRLQYLWENPYPKYDKAEVFKEKLFLNELSLMCLNGNVSTENFALLCDVEKKYIEDAHVNYLKAKKFLQSREREIEEAISILSFSDNVKHYMNFKGSLDSYKKELKNDTNVMKIDILRNDAENVLVEALAIENKLKKNLKFSFQRSVKSLAKNIKEKVKGNENEL